MWRDRQTRMAEKCHRRDKGVSLLKWGKDLSHLQNLGPSHAAWPSPEQIRQVSSTDEIPFVDLVLDKALCRLVVVSGIAETEGQSTKKDTPTEVHAECWLWLQTLETGFQGLELQQRPQLQMDLKGAWNGKGRGKKTNQNKTPGRCQVWWHGQGDGKSEDAKQDPNRRGE